jgi:enoyl-CoA hydratase
MSTGTAQPLVRVERPLPGVALVTLNRPQARNALSMALRHELVATFAGLADEPELRAVVLAAEGEVFCAGLDLKELGASADPSSAVVSTVLDDPVGAIAGFPWPVIGAIQGAAITGGFELALACDVLLASTRARFADTHARVGVLPGWGLSQKLQRLIGSARAKEMAFTGNFIDAPQALAWGLVNRVVPPEQLLPQALQLAADMAGVLPDALHAYKRLIDDGAELPLGDALALERERCAQWAARLTGEAVESRRRDVAQRGREQQSPGH